MNKRYSIGVSMIEVLVTVGVLGILAAAAMPNMRNMIDTRKLKNQTEAIADAFRLARSEAIKRAASNTPKVVSATVNAGASSTWFVGLSNTTTACTNATTCVLVQGGASNVPYMITATECDGCSVATTSNLYTFSFRGVAASGGGNSVTVTSPMNKTLRVDVSTTGRVSVCSPGGTIAGYATCV